ncbi:MAG: hypothetical protein Fues2KO_20120 [Fuerstiella sp.]
MMSENLHTVSPVRLGLRLFSAPRSLMILGSFALASFAIAAVTGAVDSSQPASELEMTVIEPSLFRQQIECDGVIEPLDAEEVHSSCYWRTTILKIVPEGTWVQEGDVICELDSSEIEEYAKKRELLLIKYRSRLENAIQSEALQESENDRRLDAAKFRQQAAVGELEEYTDARFPDQVMELERKLNVLSEQVETSSGDIRHTERLWAMGLCSRGQLEAERLRFHKLEQQHERMQSDLNFLTKFGDPRDRMRLNHNATQAQRNVARTQLSNSLALTKARLTRLSYERTLRIYERYYRRALDSIEACTLRAPCDGQVIYGNSWYLKSRGITQIEEGATVRNLQKVFEIPDPSRLKVSVPLNEASIFRVRKGMPVTVTLPAYEDVEVAGRIHYIAKYPKRRSSYTPGVKDYWLDIELLPTDEQRSLLQAKADVVVHLTLDEQDDALQIPRNAITGVAGHNFVYVYEDNELKPRALELGAANEDYVCVVDGLQAGDTLVTGMLEQHKKALDEELREDLGLNSEL